MERPFPAYKGDQPYIFVSYAHEDSEFVYPELQRFKDQGFNIWYDEGISPGASWHEELAESILNCDLFIILVTPRSAISDNCLNEVRHALEHCRPLLAVHLAPSQLSPGLERALSDHQAIIKYELNERNYTSELFGTESAWMSHIFPTPERVGIKIPQSLREDRFRAGFRHCLQGGALDRRENFRLSFRMGFRTGKLYLRELRKARGIIDFPQRMKFNSAATGHPRDGTTSPSARSIVRRIKSYR